jgi:hypothetical protein
VKKRNISRQLSLFPSQIPFNAAVKSGGMSRQVGSYRRCAVRYTDGRKAAPSAAYPAPVFPTNMFERINGKAKGEMIQRL